MDLIAALAPTIAYRGLTDSEIATLGGAAGILARNPALLHAWVRVLAGEGDAARLRDAITLAASDLDRPEVDRRYVAAALRRVLEG